MSLLSEALRLLRGLDTALGALENQRSRLATAQATVDALIEDSEQLAAEITRRLAADRDERGACRERAANLRKRAAHVGRTDERAALRCLAEARTNDRRAERLDQHIEQSEQRLSVLSERREQLHRRRRDIAHEQQMHEERSEEDRHSQVMRGFEAAIADADRPRPPMRPAPDAHGQGRDEELDQSLREELRALLQPTYRASAAQRKPQ